uniref:Uncharacterized protein n=1 Tax=Arundo donax TaxID=35708 RepID=A0A0A8YCN1_ARUDO
MTAAELDCAPAMAALDNERCRLLFVDASAELRTCSSALPRINTKPNLPLLASY